MWIARLFVLASLFCAVNIAQAQNKLTECTTRNGFHFSVGYDWSGEAITEKWQMDDFFMIDSLMEKKCLSKIKVIRLEKAKLGHILLVNCEGDSPSDAELIEINCI
jgi:hypothetical protein